MEDKGHKCHGGCNREAERAVRIEPPKPNAGRCQCGGLVDEGGHCGSCKKEWPDE